MKKQKNTSPPAGESRTRRIRLEFNHPVAEWVGIAANFNDWRPAATPMIRMGEGRWLKELVLAPGTYEYRFAVDGEWLPDPRASETVSNPCNGVNSVLRVPTPT